MYLKLWLVSSDILWTFTNITLHKPILDVFFGAMVLGEKKALKWIVERVRGFVIVAV